MNSLSSFPTPEWRHEMRWDMQQILDRVYVGPYAILKSIPALRASKITHVCLLRYSSDAMLLRPQHEHALAYVTMDIPTHPPWIPLFLSFCDLLRTITLHPKGHVLVVCRDGLCWAPGFVVAWIMGSLGMGFNDAVAYVQAKRFCVSFHDPLLRQLMEFRPVVLATQVDRGTWKAPSSSSGVNQIQGYLKQSKKEHEDERKRDRKWEEVHATPRKKKKE